MKVLLVDDDAATRFLLKRTLVRDFACEVIEAETGVEALEAIRAHAFDFVLLDVQMPVMDGIDALQAIRNSPEHARLPIVMLTAEKSEVSVRRILSLGIADYLAKPLQPGEISTRL